MSQPKGPFSPMREMELGIWEMEIGNCTCSVDANGCVSAGVVWKSMPHFRKPAELQKAVLPVSGNAWLSLKRKTGRLHPIPVSVSLEMEFGNYHQPQKMTGNITTEMETEIVSHGERSLRPKLSFSPSPMIATGLISCR